MGGGGQQVWGEGMQSRKSEGIAVKGGKGPGSEWPTDVSVYPKHFSSQLACFC